MYLRLQFLEMYKSWKRALRYYLPPQDWELGVGVECPFFFAQSNLPESDALIPVAAELAAEPELAVSTYVCKQKKKREKVSEGVICITGSSPYKENDPTMNG